MKPEMQPWKPGTPIAELPGGLPPTHLPAAVDLDLLPTLLATYLTSLQPHHLTPNALWLDMLAKTSTIRTHANSTTPITPVFTATPTDNLTTQAARRVQLASTSWISIPFTFITSHGSLLALCSGTAFLTLSVPTQKWQIFSLTTILESFSSHPSPDVPPHSPRSPSHALPTPTSPPSSPSQPQPQPQPQHRQVLIIGAGQNGLALGARLSALSIPYLILEKNTIGSRWTSRYDSVRQHTVRGLNELPLGSTWEEEGEDEFLRGESVKRGFERWVQRWGVEVWEGCEVLGCRREGQGWRVSVRSRRGGGEEVMQLTSRHVAFALGGGLSVARWPEVAVREKEEGLFEGRVMHTVEFKNSKGWKGRGVVVGTGTAAHDIAQDMFDNGLDVTMVQRGKTAVYPIEWYAGNHRGLVALGLENEAMDRLALGVPVKIAGEMQRRSYEAYVQTHRGFFEGLERAGFRTGLGDGVDRIPDEIVYNHFGGYYIDVGTSRHIIDGDIKIVNGTIDHFTTDGLVVQGKEVNADYVVFATGQESDYRKDLESILPMARSLAPVWGLTENGDPRGMMQEAAPGLWLLMGSAAHARFYSRFIALQIQEQMLRRESKM